MGTFHVGMLAALFVLTSSGARGDDLPDDAKAIVAEYQKAAGVIQDRADNEMAALRERVLPRLKSLQDKYCRATRLDDAVAIRDAIRQLSGVLPDPGVVHATAQDVGKSYLFEVTGTIEGSIWGTEVYTSDSHLGACAVHAGVLKPGEKGVVRVRILPGQKSYAGSSHNGVTSQGYGAWDASFVMERVKSPIPAGG